LAGESPEQAEAELRNAVRIGETGRPRRLDQKRPVGETERGGRVVSDNAGDRGGRVIGRPEACVEVATKVLDDQYSSIRWIGRGAASRSSRPSLVGVRVGSRGRVVLAARDRSCG
jgi:hypothetical protein